MIRMGGLRRLFLTCIWNKRVAPRRPCVSTRSTKSWGSSRAFEFRILDSSGFPRDDNSLDSGRIGQANADVFVGNRDGLAGSWRRPSCSRPRTGAATRNGWPAHSRSCSASCRGVCARQCQGVQWAAQRCLGPVLGLCPVSEGTSWTRGRVLRPLSARFGQESAFRANVLQ